MSYRTRRLRKKLRIGEFQELCFHVSGKLKGASSESYDQFVNDFIAFLEAVNLFIGGGTLDDGFSFWVDGGPKRTLTDEDRFKVLKFLESHPSVREAQSGSLMDAWHGRIERFD